MKFLISTLGIAVALTATLTLNACGGGGGGGTTSTIATPATLQSIVVQADQTTLAAGLNTSVHAIGHYSDGSIADITNGTTAANAPSITNVSWTATPTNIANFITASSNDLRTTLPGTVVVTAKDFFTGVTGTLTITVAAAAPASLAISGMPSSQTISARTAAQLSAQVVKTDGSTQAASSVTWTSSNPSVATVDANGNFQGLGAGSVTITASSGGFSKSVSLTLLAPLGTPLVTVSCDPSNPSIVNAQQWNNQYAIDSDNATEWVAVNGTSCQSYAAVELLVPQSAGSSTYFVRFFAARSPGNPTVFQPGNTYGQLSSGQTVTIGQTNSSSLQVGGTFSAIYNVLAQ